MVGLVVVVLGSTPNAAVSDVTTKAKEKDKAKEQKFQDVYQVWWSRPNKGMVFYSESDDKAKAEKAANALRTFPSMPTVEVRGPFKRPVNDKSKLFAIVFQRKSTSKDGLVTGTVTVNGTVLGTFYENEDKKIPVGTYKGVLRTTSGKNHAQGPGGKMGNKGDFLIEVAGVSGRTDILLHAGNKKEHSEGCILMGPVQVVSGEKIAPAALKELRKLFFDGEDNPKQSPNKTITIEVKGPVTKPAQEKKELGWLSKKYEVGANGNAGTISSGKGDPGGQSYGLYQLTTANVKGFVNKHYATEFKGLTAGTEAFNNKWKEIYKTDPTGFAKKQHEYIKETHYDPAVANILKDVKLDVSKRGFTLQNVVWSTAVHHGKSTRVFERAIAPLVKEAGSIDKVTDEQIIRAIYAERGRTDAKGNLVYFQSSSQEVQKGVKARFVSELADALAALKSE